MAANKLKTNALQQELTRPPDQLVRSHTVVMSVTPLRDFCPMHTALLYIYMGILYKVMPFNDQDAGTPNVQQAPLLKTVTTCSLLDPPMSRVWISVLGRSEAS